jgi:hypothetical protein
VKLIRRQALSISVRVLMAFITSFLETMLTGVFSFSTGNLAYIIIRKFKQRFNGKFIR